jgi:hypothetical protein
VADRWEREEGEPPQAFAAFVVYRDMGPLRSLMKAAHAIIAVANSPANSPATPPPDSDCKP